MRLGFEGRVIINRKDWGINYSKLADNGGLVAANEVAIEPEAIRKSKTDFVASRNRLFYLAKLVGPG